MPSKDHDELQLLIFEQERFLDFVPTHAGDVVIRQEKVGQVSPLEFFTHPLIIDELELETATVDAITSHFDSAIEKQRKLKNEFDKNLHPTAKPKLNSRQVSEEAETLNDALTKNRREFVDKAFSELTATEKKRLRHVQLQFLLYRNGYLTFLNKAADALHLAEVPFNDLKKQQKRVAKSLLEKEKELVSEALDIWLESLTEPQRKTFDRDWKSVFDSPGALGRLVSYLESDFEFDPDEIRSDELQLIWSPPTWRHSANGNFDLVARTKAKQTLPSASDRHRKSRTENASALSKLYALQHLLRSEFVGELIALVPEQNLQITAINEEFEKLQTDKTLRIAGKFEVPIKKIAHIKGKDGKLKDLIIYDWPKDRSLIETETQKSLNEPAKQTFDKLLNVLLPHQVEHLKLAVVRLQIRSHGPLADIRYGELKQELGLSDMDVETLNKSAANAHEFLCEMSRGTRDDAMKTINEALPAAIRHRMQLELGEPMTHGHCDLGTLAFALLIIPENEPKNEPKNEPDNEPETTARYRR